MRVDGVALAATAAAFLSATGLQAGFNVDSDGGYFGGYAVWTGATGPAATGTTNCTNFTSATSNVSSIYGVEKYTANWFNHSTISCDYTLARLYCLQQ